MNFILFLYRVFTWRHSIKVDHFQMSLRTSVRSFFFHDKFPLSLRFKWQKHGQVGQKTIGALRVWQSAQARKHCLQAASLFCRQEGKIIKKIRMKKNQKKKPGNHKGSKNSKDTQLQNFKYLIFQKGTKIFSKGFQILIYS